MILGPNPKAFAVANPGRQRKQAVRSHDVCFLLQLDGNTVS